ncbi:hypothetical protein [Sporomusa carbonis]|uniref:hypothetical protein n=1 Tax=Sporomusa carbonis TaxID=3076075 RepID=UPI003C7A03B7
MAISITYLHYVDFLHDRVGDNIRTVVNYRTAGLILIKGMQAKVASNRAYYA